MDAVIDTIIIQTTKLEELAKFYQEGFDLQAPKPFNDDHLGFQLPGVYLGFDLVDEINNSQPGAISLWFRVDNLEDTFNRLVSLGARIKYPPQKKPFGDTLAAVFDPDGNTVGLSQR